ncbi:hypothetical protein BGZ47_000991 [Haplosporangium gracile]|nr:hypothetical protein BGZ47_000991 [Haplosporangium gracile]
MGKGIQRFLCSAPNLRDFHLLASSRTKAGPDPCLDTTDVVQSEWVCLDLEVFGCGIGGISRSDISPSDYEEDEEDELFNEDMPLRQFDCLAMSLESGLDLLRDLKDLSHVELVDMEVCVDGNKEQARFSKHWPYTKTMATTSFSELSCEDLLDAAMQYAALTLEVLRISGVACTISSDIHRLLCAVPKLKELRFSKLYTGYDSRCLDAQEIVGSLEENWICSELEVFA